MPALAGEGAREPGEISRRRFGPARAVGVLAVQVDEQSPERPDVLVVVPDDVDERPRLAPAQVVQIARRDLPAGDVTVAPEPEQLGLDRGEPRVGHAVAKHAPHDRQEIEVALVQRWVRPGHPEPGDEQRPVEPPAVVRDQPAATWDPRRELGEERRLVGMVRQEQLDLAEEAALPPSEPDEERKRAGRRGKPGRLRVQAEQGSVGRRLAGQRGKPIAVDRQQRRWCLDQHERAEPRPDELAIDRRRQSLRPDARGANPVRGRGARRGRPRRDPGPEVREPPLERDGRERRLGHAAPTAAGSAPLPLVVPRRSTS